MNGSIDLQLKPGKRLLKNVHTASQMALLYIQKQVWSIKLTLKKLLSNRNTCESLGEFKHAVETLAYVSCSDSISGSPKLPPVLLQLDRNKVHMHFLFIS